VKLLNCTRVVILGAGGHTVSLLDLLKSNGVVVQGIYDDCILNPDFSPLKGVSISGAYNQVPLTVPIVVSKGDSKARKLLVDQFRDQLLEENVVHSKAYVSPNMAGVGIGNQIFAFSFLNGEVVLGDFNLINSGAIIEHEVRIGDFNHIAPGSVLCGRVEIGNRCLIGANSVLIHNVKVHDDIIIGAGSVVINDLIEPGVYYGSPAKKC